MKWYVAVTAILSITAVYGFYCYNHPTANGVALSATVGAIALVAGVSYRNIKEILRGDGK